MVLATAKAIGDEGSHWRLMLARNGSLYGRDVLVLPLFLMIILARQLNSRESGLSTV
jgi:hypothetical protein